MVSEFIVAHVDTATGPKMSCFAVCTHRLLSHRSRQRERLNALGLSICLSVCLSVCLSPKCKKTCLSQKLSTLELWSLLTTYIFITSHPWAFQGTHYWTPKIQDGGDSPSWILTPICKKAIFLKTKQFRAMVSIVYL